jgi:hypothetical protein
MPAHFIALSDLHLGYDNSCLTSPKAHANLAAALADLCGGDTDRLILNGDTFEACVPHDAGTYDPAGFNPAMSACSRSFFSALLDRISIQSLIIVWGNHDYAMWKRLASACGVSTFTNLTKGDLLLQNGGVDLPNATGFLNDVVGPARSKILRVRSAYPNYILGRYWPYLVFHHGHFLDDLVIGQDEDAKYLELRVLTGVGRPDVNVHGDETVKSLYDKTEAFISATWEYNSRAREVEWAMIRRLQDQPQSCSYYPTENAPSSLLVPPTETFGPAPSKYLLWYANVLMADATTPPPLGHPSDPSYLFLGHDHRGGFADVSAMDERPWKIVNTGGWTNDGCGSAVHGHATVWSKNENIPRVHCVRV